MDHRYGPYDYHEGRDAGPRQEHDRRVRNQINRRVVLRDAQNPFDISVPEFRRLYRMPQHVFFELVDALAPFCVVRHRHNAVPLPIRILCSVGFYASGSYQRMFGRNVDINVCQTSVSVYIQEVTNALNHPHLMSQFLKFPQTHRERELVIQRNDRLFGLPRVLGCVDGTLVKIVPPKLDVRAGYYCRKGYTALNVQVVCDADLKVLSIDARFPGSCNDSYIFRNSGLSDEMQVAYWESRCWLLGDSGYGHAPWIHLPLPHAPRETPEARYTDVQCRARNVVERCIGVMKARWRCLLNDRTLHYKPDKAGLIVNACAVLHNFLKLHHVPNPEPINVPADQGEDIFEDIDIPVLPPALQRVLANQELNFLIEHVENNR